MGLAWLTMVRLTMARLRLGLISRLWVMFLTGRRQMRGTAVFRIMLQMTLRGSNIGLIGTRRTRAATWTFILVGGIASATEELQTAGTSIVVVGNVVLDDFEVKGARSNGTLVENGIVDALAVSVQDGGLDGVFLRGRGRGVGNGYSLVKRRVHEMRWWDVLVNLVFNCNKCEAGLQKYNW
jgi:hypothetical protein